MDLCTATLLQSETLIHLEIKETFEVAMATHKDTILYYALCCALCTLMKFR